MKQWLSYLSLWVLVTIVSGSLFAQKNYYDSLLTERVKVENPEYKPVVGIGIGSFSFLGDVQNEYWHLFSNNPGLRITVSSFLDKKHNYRLDFNILKGSLSGNQGSNGNHLNFYTDISSFGASVFYKFSNLYRKSADVFPYISVGIETFFFNSKGDLKGPDGQYYIYNEDGTIRDHAGNITTQDYMYETDLRSMDIYGRGNYPEYGFSVPVEIGFEAALSKRVSMRAGTSLHITSTDLIDNVDKSSTGIDVNRRNDYFTFTFITLHLDLFSEPEFRKVERMYAEIPDDNVLTGDADKDWVLDFNDQCPSSPPGVPVDSTGCPLDSDQDGIPDYLDKEIHTPPGALIDKEGRRISDSLLVNLIDKEKGANLTDMDYYLSSGSKINFPGGTKIPLKFREFDVNHDGEISFNELLDAIDKYFDYRTFLSLQDIYELMNFYFSQ